MTVMLSRVLDCIFQQHATWRERTGLDYPAFSGHILIDHILDFFLTPNGRWNHDERDRKLESVSIEN